MIAKQKKVTAVAKADVELAAAAALSKRAKRSRTVAEPAGADLVSATFTGVVAPGRNKEALGDAADRIWEREANLTAKPFQFEDDAGSASVAEVIEAAEPRVASRPTNEHTDRHLSVNFDRAANSVTFDVDGDDAKSMGKKKGRMTWDRKKKK